MHYYKQNQKNKIKYKLEMWEKLGGGGGSTNNHATERVNLKGKLQYFQKTKTILSGYLNLNVFMVSITRFT